jgi:hypothetical protein
MPAPTLDAALKELSLDPDFAKLPKEWQTNIAQKLVDGDGPGALAYGRQTVKTPLTVQNIPELAPQEMAEYNRRKAAGDTRSWEQWAADHQLADPKWLNSLQVLAPMNNDGAQGSPEELAALDRWRGKAQKVVDGGSSSTNAEDYLLNQAINKGLADIEKDKERAEMAGKLRETYDPIFKSGTATLAGLYDGTQLEKENKITDEATAKFLAGLDTQRGENTAALNTFTAAEKAALADQVAGKKTALGAEVAARQAALTAQTEAQRKAIGTEVTARQGALATQTAAQRKAIEAELATKNAALATDLTTRRGAIGTEVDARNAALATLGASRKGAIASEVGEYRSALATELDQKGAALTTEIASLGAAITTATASRNTALAADLVSRKAALEDEVVKLRAAQEPLNAERLNAAQAQSTAVNLASQAAQDRTLAQFAQDGYVGGSSGTDAALMRASIAGRQGAAEAIGNARVANAGDVAGIERYSAKEGRGLADYGSGETRTIADTDTSQNFDLSKYGAGQGRELSNYGATENRDVSNYGTKEGRTLADMLSNDTRTIADYGSGQNRELTDFGSTEGRRLTDFGAGQYRTADDFASSEGRKVSDYGSGQYRTANDFASSEGRKGADYASGQQRMVADFGTNAARDQAGKASLGLKEIGEFTADEKRGIGEQDTKAKVSLFANDTSRRLANLDRPSSLMNTQLKMYKDADDYGQSGFDRTMNNLKLFSTSGGNAPTVKPYEMPGGSVEGSAYQNLGAGLASMGMNYFSSGKFKPKTSGIGTAADFDPVPKK